MSSCQVAELQQRAPTQRKQLKAIQSCSEIKTDYTVVTDASVIFHNSISLQTNIKKSLKWEL